MSKLKKMEILVRGVLEEEPQTRNSDMDLYLAICHKINPVVCNLPFSTVINNRDDFKLPSPFSVSRTRRKLQAENPDLRAVKEVEDARYEEWKEFRDYATNED